MAAQTMVSNSLMKSDIPEEVKIQLLKYVFIQRISIWGTR